MFSVIDNHDFIINKGFWLTVYIKNINHTPVILFLCVYLNVKGLFLIILLHLELYFMKNSENNKSLLRRYLDDLYTMDDARKLLDELQTSEYDTDMLQDLAAEVWEETSCNHRRQTLNANNIKKRRDCY